MSSLIHTLKNYSYLMRLHKPIGTLLLLWPTLWGLWFANQGVPPLRLLIIFILGVLVMRAAGCVMNDIADRQFDAHVQRTQNRPLATGAIKPSHAWILFFILILMALSLVLLTNRLTLLLAMVGLLLAMVYPFSKRFIRTPQALLGLAFAWGIPLGFSASLNAVPGSAWWLCGITGLWIIAFDTQYALMDREDDLRIGIKSTAILFGRYDLKIIILLQTLMLVGLVLLGQWHHANFYYYGALAVAAVLFVHQAKLVRKENYLRAFLNNNGVGFVIFIGIVLWLAFPSSR